MRTKKAFSLIEILVVLSVIALLISILLPCLRRSRGQARQLLCKSNIRQLVLSNSNYAHDNDGFYMPGSEDILTANLCRWFGRRKDTDSPFDITCGPLFSYADIRQIRCPLKVRYHKLDLAAVDYDCGSGGYGYNLIYIGSKVWSQGYEASSLLKTARQSEISHPGQTVMFADTAMIKDQKLIEYSFAEPRYFLMQGKINPGWNPSPSLHFRHLKNVTIGYSDGHAGSKKMQKIGSSNPDLAIPEKFNLGWFAPLDNSCFDLD